MSSCGCKALQYVRFKYPYKPTVRLLFSDASYYGSSPKHVLGEKPDFSTCITTHDLEIGLRVQGLPNL